MEPKMRRIGGHLVTDMRSSARAKNTEKRRRIQLHNDSSDEDNSEDNDEARPIKREKKVGRSILNRVENKLE